jgi:hypothetical protein
MIIYGKISPIKKIQENCSPYMLSTESTTTQTMQDQKRYLMRTLLMHTLQGKNVERHTAQIMTASKLCLRRIEWQSQRHLGLAENVLITEHCA